MKRSNYENYFSKKVFFVSPGLRGKRRPALDRVRARFPRRFRFDRTISRVLSSSGTGFSARFILVSSINRVDIAGRSEIA